MTFVNGHTLIPLPADWSQAPTLSVNWYTEISGAKRGHEDRAALRTAPRATYTWLAASRNLVENQMLEDTVRSALQSSLAAVPFHAGPSYANALFNGGGTLQLETPSLWQWQTGDYLLVVRDNGTWVVRQATYVNVEVLQMNLDLPLAPGDIAGAAQVFPLLFGRIETDTATVTGEPDLLMLPLQIILSSWRVGTAVPQIYLGAPLAPLPPIDWSESQNRTFNYDPNVDQIGFGEESRDPQQSYVAHSSDFKVWLDNAAAIAALEAFFGYVDGRRRAFWLPAAERAMLIVGGASTSAFYIQDQGLSATFLNHPDLYLWFQHPTLGAAAGKIAGVLPASDGREYVTLAAPLAINPDADWDVFRLRLVRLAADEMLETYEADSRASAKIQILEVPLEYAMPGSGLTPGAVPSKPVFLYRFAAELDATTTWFQTSHDIAVTWGGDTYAPAKISHSDAGRSIKNQAESITVSSFLEAGNPLALYLPFPPSARLVVTVRRVDLGGDVTVAPVVFEGLVSNVKFTGRKLEATVSSPIDWMDRKLPGMIIGTPCNAPLFGPGCNLDKAAYAVAGTISHFAGNYLYLTADPGKPQNWFAAGHFVVGAGANTEIRTILASSANTLLLSQPLYKNAAGAVLTMYPGCQHNPSDCKNKFGNFVNYQGHPLIPETNPTLVAVVVKSDGSGGK